MCRYAQRIAEEVELPDAAEAAKGASLSEYGDRECRAAGRNAEQRSDARLSSTSPRNSLHSPLVKAEVPV